MIISHIIGGLGNQMFQYATGISIAKKYKTKLLLNISDYKHYENRNFMLNNYNITAKIASSKLIHDYIKLAKLPYRIIPSKILYRIFHKNFYKQKPNLIPDSNWDQTIYDQPDNTYLQGSFMSYKYFENNAETIRKHFILKFPISIQNQKYLKTMQNSQSLAIHIRRGDYVSNHKFNRIHGLCNLNYYKQAIRYIERKYKNINLYFFSDDIPWVKGNLKPKNKSTYISGNENKPWEDMYLMSQCKHNIIANSTFSWWGAWLNHNPNKIVISPKTWFSAKNKSSKDIIPNNWIEI